MRYCAWLAGLTVLMAAGCTSPRLVSQDTRGGCVAIADSSDIWPSYNMTKAKDLINKQCPTGYTIVKQQEVVVGQQTTNSTERNSQEVPIAKGVAVDVQQTTRNTSTTRDQTEYRIWYQKN